MNDDTNGWTSFGDSSLFHFFAEKRSGEKSLCGGWVLWSNTPLGAKEKADPTKICPTCKERRDKVKRR